MAVGVGLLTSSVRGVPWALVLNLEALASKRVSVHLGNGSRGRLGVVVGDKPKALALARELVDKDLGADDVAKWHEHGAKHVVVDLLWQVVDKEVGAHGPLLLRRARGTSVGVLGVWLLAKARTCIPIMFNTAC